MASPLGMIRHTSLLALAVALASGCAAPAAAPGPSPVDAPAPVALDPLDAPWIVTGGAGAVTHEIRLESSLLSRIDTVERRDTVRTVVAAQWSRLAGDAPARISGLLTSYRVSADSSEPAPLPGLLLPLPFSATEGVGGAQVRLVRPDVAACTLDAAAVSALREVFVSAPRRLEPGTSWSDSAHYTTCRDSIPLDVHSTRGFRVTGAERRNGEIVLLVERRSQVRMQGEGYQFGEPLSITAEGEGSVQLVLRLAGAFVIAANGESTLRMTMRGRRRSQELTQHTRITVVAR